MPSTTTIECRGNIAQTATISQFTANSDRIDRRIEVVTTDTTGMKETAFGTIETCRAVYDVLKGSYTDVRFTVAMTLFDLDQIVDRCPDLVVLCNKYLAENETEARIWLSEYFANHRVPFTGSSRETLAFDSDKAKAKKHLIDRRLATPHFFLADAGSISSEDQLPLTLPLFVKPLDAANGNGIDEGSLVHDFAGYEARVAKICAVYQTCALVEDVLPGREFTVAVLDDVAHSKRLIMPIEIVVPKNTKGDRVLGSAEKSGNTEVLSLVVEPELSAVSLLASKVFSALGARDFGRIDIKLDADGVPNFIEANLVPGMTPGSSYFPQACSLNRDMSYSDTVLKIIELALSRSEASANVPNRVAANLHAGDVGQNLIVDRLL